MSSTPPPGWRPPPAPGWQPPPGQPYPAGFPPPKGWSTGLIITVSLLGGLAVAAILVVLIVVPKFSRVVGMRDNMVVRQRLREYTMAQSVSYAMTDAYGSIDDLAAAGFLGAGWSEGCTFDSHAYASLVGANGQTFALQVTPAPDSWSSRHYYVDETFVVRFADGEPAGPEDAVMQEEIELPGPGGLPPPPYQGPYRPGAVT